ncbi:methyltransferase-like protein 27 [Procambarus clarkii]|uniref:methyltransferase-like protein 27 n=1 Tax=Procambarus clarkii TaxID=6728 RepID=UPI001E671087|nr:uncharacterized protein LOC123771164 [Procambarus clarkii]
MENNFDEQTAAFHMNSLFFKEKRSPGEVADIYSAWSKTYEQLMNSNTYAGPAMAAEEVAKMVPDTRREEVRVLDVAAGTGKVGIELYKRGFTWVEAVEPSSGMLEILSNTGVYSKAYKDFLGHGDSSIPKAAFDVVVNVGGMGEGHIPVQGIDDMISFVKPGGLVVVVMRQEYLDNVEEYRGRLETRMNLLEKSGQWHKVVRKMVPNYFCDKSGIIFVYQVV